MIVIGAALAVMAMIQAFEYVAMMTQCSAAFISSASPINAKATYEPGSAKVHVQTERREVKGLGLPLAYRLKNCLQLIGPSLDGPRTAQE